MRMALVVGIDYYRDKSLRSCVSNARAMTEMLECNANGKKNFDVKTLARDDVEIVSANVKDKSDVKTLPKENAGKVSETELMAEIKKLLKSQVDTALLYFAGKAALRQGSEFLLASDSGLESGISLATLQDLANQSSIPNIVIIIDAQRAFDDGIPADETIATLDQGVTIISALDPDSYTEASNYYGVFTHILADALSGRAADLLGSVSLASAYAQISQILSLVQRQPSFKSNVKRFVTLREAKATVEAADLKGLAALFGVLDKNNYPLDPSYEPTEPSAVPEKNEIFALLQRMNRVNLVVPVDEVHMYYAAINSKSCKLTELGQHYLHLVTKGRI